MSETKKCSKCGKPLKKRIEVEHSEFNECYKCFKGLKIRREEHERL